jgi:hypothetical protein
MSTNAKQNIIDPVIRRYDSRIAMTLACDFLMLGSEKTGSFALAAEKSSHFVRSLEWYADIVAAQINTVLIPRLMMVNNVPVEVWPTVKPSKVAEHDIRDLGLALQQIATAGLLTATPQLEAHLRDQLHMPAATADERELMEQRIAASQTAATEDKPSVRPDVSPEEVPEAKDPETEIPEGSDDA